MLKKLILWGSLKNPVFRGSHTKNAMYRGIAYKGGLGQFAGLRGYLAKKRRVVFLRGKLIPQ